MDSTRFERAKEGAKLMDCFFFGEEIECPGDRSMAAVRCGFLRDNFFFGLHFSLRLNGNLVAAATAAAFASL